MASDVGAPIAIALASFFVTAAFWVLFPHFRVSAGTDYAGFYEPVARRIVAGSGYVDSFGEPALRYPPGYPLIVAGVFSVASATRLPEAFVFAALSHLAMALSAVLLWRIGRSVWSSASAMLPALVWAGYPLALWLSLQLGSETTFSAVFYAAVAVSWLAMERTRPRVGSFVAAGVLFGAAMLIRPIAIGAWVVTLGVLWMCRGDLSRRFRAGLSTALLIGVLVPVAPWQMWVWRETGRVVMLSDGGSPSIRDGLTFALSEKRYRTGVTVPENVEALMWRIEAHHDTLDSVGAIARKMTSELADDPLSVTSLFAIKGLRSWYGTDSHRLEFPVAAVQLVFVLPAMIGVWLAWRHGGCERRLAGMVTGFVLYFWLMTVLVLSIARYMVPVTGLLFLFLPVFLMRRTTSQRGAT